MMYNHVNLLQTWKQDFIMFGNELMFVFADQRQYYYVENINIHTKLSYTICKHNNGPEYL